MYEEFLKQVESHKMTVLKEDGIYRHLRFQRPGTRCMSFDIVTWPGYLVYTGDMGSYTFMRLRDMFEFFRKPPGKESNIDFRYWAEKCEAHDRADGIDKFCLDRFGEEVYYHFKLFCEGEEDLTEEEVNDLAEELQTSLSLVDNEHEAYQMIGSFDHEIRPRAFGKRRLGFAFVGGEFGRCREWSYRFQWCCYALPWAIKMYDEAKEKVDG